MASGHKQTEALKNACQYALTVQKALPNYICDETVRRFNQLDWLMDTIETQVTVIEGKDSYSNIRINGNPAQIATSQLPGVWSSGEFGMLVPLLFAPDNRATLTFKREERLKSRPALLFDFDIRKPDNRSFFVWNLGGKMLMPGYRGSLWVDKETSRPVRIRAKSTPVEIREVWGSDTREVAEIDTEYDDVPLADGTSFLLPARSRLKSCRHGITNVGTTCNRNELKYTNCHKFRAKAKIVGVE
jgi:hypothetical protein